MLVRGPLVAQIPGGVHSTKTSCCSVSRGRQWIYLKKKHRAHVCNLPYQNQGIDYDYIDKVITAVDRRRVSSVVNACVIGRITANHHNQGLLSLTTIRPGIHNYIKCFSVGCNYSSTHNQINLRWSLGMDESLHPTIYVDVVDQCHTYQNTPVPYPTMYHPEQRCSALNGVLWDMG